MTAAPRHHGSGSAEQMFGAKQQIPPAEQSDEQTECNGKGTDEPADIQTNGATNMRALTYVASLALALTTFAASAAEMTYKDVPKSKGIQAYTIVWIDGRIEEGDYEKFARFVSKRNRVMVALNSDGGLISEGLNIGLLIRQKAMVTAVYKDCVSVCGLMWLAGTYRVVSTEAAVGFHAAYRLENGKPVEDGSANALVGGYLMRLGFSWAAIEYLTSAPSETVEWLNSDKAKKYGIVASVYEPKK
jgi:hypothetical protein